jgi:hypothetical protein
MATLEDKNTIKFSTKKGIENFLQGNKDSNEEIG